MTCGTVQILIQCSDIRCPYLQDSRTKETIELKMAELDQQMMMEHRNKRKTTKYYRKLVEATKSGKG